MWRFLLLFCVCHGCASVYMEPVTRYSRSHFYAEVHYKDYYSHYFWNWIKQQPVQQKALWAYHHKPYMDPDRYTEFVRDTKVKNMIQDMMQANVAMDPLYNPPGINKELIYRTIETNATLEQKIIGLVGLFFLLVLLFYGLKLCGI